MGQTNYHIHSTYCDGDNTVEEMAKACYDAGLTSIGFSSHFTEPLNTNDCGIDENKIDAYLSDVEREKFRYQDKGMEVLAGFEADYWPHLKDVSPLFKSVRDKLDYMIGSVHYFGIRPDGKRGYIDWKEDTFEQTAALFYPSVRELVEDYYKNIGDMAETVKPDIIGHIDLIRWTSLRLGKDLIGLDEEWYKKAYRQALERIRDAGCILEVNTGGISRYKDPSFLYPSTDILTVAADMRVPLMVNGDSHFTQAVTTYFKEADELLKSLGVRSVMVYRDGTFQPEAL